MTSPSLARFLAVLSFAAAPLACSASDADQASGPGPTGGGPSIGSCTGHYDCAVFQDDQWLFSTQGDLVRQGIACVWQDDANASRTLSLADATIRGTSFEFHYPAVGSVPAQDIVCSAVAPPESGACSGVADTCSTIPLGDCYAQGGCHYEIGDSASTTDDRCAGSPYGCSTYDRRADCEGHRGCMWH